MAFDSQIRGGTFDLVNLTAQYLRDNYLTGIQVQGIPDTFFQEHLLNAMEFVAHETGVAIADEVVADEPHDYISSDFLQYGFLRLNRLPIKSVDRIDGVYSGSVLFTFPTEWLRVDRTAGQVQIVPFTGNMTMITQGGAAYIPLLGNATSVVPQLWHVAYTAGWEDASIPRRLIEAVCKKAAIDILAILGDLIYGPGITSRSVSADGLSQTTSLANSGADAAIFGGRIARYTRDLWGDPTARTDQDGLLLSIRKEYRGPTISSL